MPGDRMAELRPGEHSWYELRLTSTVVMACRVCGTVRRRDGNNRPCRGATLAPPPAPPRQAEPAAPGAYAQAGPLAGAAGHPAPVPPPPAPPRAPGATSEGEQMRHAAALLGARLRGSGADPALAAEAAAALAGTADAYAVAIQQNAGLLETLEQMRRNLQAAQGVIEQQSAELALLRRRTAA